MFEGLLKSRFFSKCKSNIKLTRTRVEMIRKKRNATEKYLRNDISDLLKNGLDINAYGRAEGLLVEMNRSACYEIVDQYCEDVLKNLQTMNKERECPEECKEAVASLMFAAARFADLPELRELRSIFSERYGKTVDFYVNKQLTEKLKSTLPSKDTKLQLLQDVVAESGLEWDSKALENKLFNDLSCNKGSDDEQSVKKDDEQNETINQKEVPLLLKDITIARRSMNKPNEQIDDKPLKYSSIPPPYTKSVGPTPAAEEKENHNQAKPVAKSVRRRHIRPPSGSFDGDVNKDKAAEGQRFFDNDERGEEDTMMDKLLHHYSQKKGSLGKAKVDYPSDSRKHPSNEVPSRVSSLPTDLMSPTETPKKHTRATSLQPELLNGNGHVHPKLPDYDNFVARLSAFRRSRGD